MLTHMYRLPGVAFRDPWKMPCEHTGSVGVGPTGMGLDAGAAEPPAYQLEEGMHPAHSNVSWLSWSSAVCPPLEHGMVPLGRLLRGLQYGAAWGGGVWSQQLLIQSEELGLWE